MMRLFQNVFVLLAICVATSANAQEQPQPKPLLENAQWNAGPLADENFFPLAVWVQNPSKAPEYKKAGINTYVGLWRGPTAEQLVELEKHGMHAVCAQNRTGLANQDNKTIIAWMHGDEPDNAQSLGAGKGYGPPIPPEKIIEDYKKLKAADPSRPVLLNLGQGVAWDGWHGRGVGPIIRKTIPSMSKGQTSSPSTFTRRATITRTWPANCGWWPTA